MKSIATLIFLSIFSFGEALLPPAWQSVAELQAILQNEQLKNYLQSGDLIEKIQRTNNGWIISTNHSEIMAIVTPESQSIPGPQKFTINFNP